MRQNVPADQNVVGTSDGFKPRDIKFHPASYAWDYDMDVEEGCGKWIAPSLMDDSFAAWVEVETPRQCGTDGASRRSSPAVRSFLAGRPFGGFRVKAVAGV